MRGKLIGVTVLALSGCSYSAAEIFRENGLQRAAFEMQCDQDRIQIVELMPATNFRGWGGQVGVSGCGKRLVYVNPNGGGWIVNTVSDSK